VQAIILAGGLSRRLGGVPKAGLLLDGQTLLARTVDAAAAFLAEAPTTSIGEVSRPAPIVVVGPVESIAGWLATAKSGADTVAVQEDPPFAGPAAGIAAGLSALAGDAGYVLVLACDMPHAGAIVELLAPKLASCTPGEGIMAVADGRKQPLAAIYPLAELRNAVVAARAAHRLENASVFSLIANVNIKECAVPSGLAADIDTWADARAQGMGAGPANAEGQQLENHDEALQAWTKKLLEAFEIADIDVDVDAVLNLAGVAAHSIVRPAAPLTTFVAGLAAGLAAGTGQASEAAAMAAALGMAKKLAAAEAAVVPAAAVPPAAPDTQTPAGN
jgi:molybdopterin-guanine dinucleotide biosynthesis protein A